VYKIFSNVYTGEHSADDLMMIGIERVSEPVYGFIEMQTMKVGALLDTPQDQRAQLLEKERAKQLATSPAPHHSAPICEVKKLCECSQAKEKQEQAERAAQTRSKEAAIVSKMHSIDRQAYESRLPLAQQVSSWLLCCTLK
ncbi:MAG: hypothetical protein SGPRY_009058, partial [Prymnesium sp.]